MGRLDEKDDGLPTTSTPKPTRRRAIWLRLLSICALLLVQAVLLTDLALFNIPLHLENLSLYLFPVQSNELCPQAPPFHLPASNLSIDLPSSSDLAHLLSGAVQVDTSVGDDWPTVPQDPARWEAVFSPFHEYLRSAFPLIHGPDSPIKLELVNTWGLLYTFAGSDDSLPPLVLMAHQDVVPVEPETVSAWTHPPFSGFIDDELGLVWGRGAGDCKASLISILATLESLLKAGFKPQRSIICSFGFDEESAGTQGGLELANFLHERYGDGGVAMIVDEGGGIDLDLGIKVASPTVAEKGYLDARITVHTPGGHSSAPRDHTSIGLLSQLVTAIEANPYKAAIQLAGKKPDEVNPALQFLQCTRDAPNADRELSKALKKLEKIQRKVQIGSKVSRRWLEKRLDRQAKKVLGLMDRWQRFGFQTTQAVDLIAGGVKINALPEQATTVVNHRIDVYSSTDEVRLHIYRTLKPVAKRLNLTLEGDGQTWNFILSSTASKSDGKVVLSDAFESALEPAPLTPIGPTAAPWSLLQGVIRSVWEDVLVAPDVMGGNTDTKSYWNLTRHIFRFSPGSDQPFPIKDEGDNIHTVDERTTIDGLVKATQFYALLIQAVGLQRDV